MAQVDSGRAALTWEPLQQGWDHGDGLDGGRACAPPGPQPGRVGVHGQGAGVGVVGGTVRGRGAQSRARRGVPAEDASDLPWGRWGRRALRGSPAGFWLRLGFRGNVQGGWEGGWEPEGWPSVSDSVRCVAFGRECRSPGSDSGAPSLTPEVWMSRPRPFTACIPLHPTSQFITKKPSWSSC